MEMKLIKHNGYWIVVSDEKPRDKEWCLASYGPKNDKDNYIAYADNIHLGNVEHGEALLFSYNNFTHEIGYCKKILFSQNPEHNLPTINFSDEVAKELGIVDVEKLAETKSLTFLEKISDLGKKVFWKIGFTVGYNQCLSNNADKLFTLEDMREGICEAWNTCEDNEDEETFRQVFERIIQSLTKEEYFCELEMEAEKDSFNYDGLKLGNPLQPKSVTIKKIWLV